MKQELFDELVASVREGGAILRGEVAPSRRFTVKPTDVKRIRANYKLSNLTTPDRSGNNSAGGKFGKTCQVWRDL
ncbi:MAG: hypothetical protein HZB17_09175 [Chloroflexi bacterium]|nr:hypothetical protein [Chloroflexota bacterium]